MDGSVKLSTLSKIEVVEEISLDIKRIAIKFTCSVSYKSSYDDMVSEGYYAAAIFLDSYYEDGTLQSLRSYVYRSVSNACYKNLNFKYRDVCHNYSPLTHQDVASAIGVSYIEQQVSLNEWYRSLSEEDSKIFNAISESSTILEASEKLDAYRDRISKKAKMYSKSLKETLIQSEVY